MMAGEKRKGERHESASEKSAVRWDDGSVTEQPNLERPFILFENGKPRCFYFATGVGERAYQIDHSFNIAVPIGE